MTWGLVSQSEQNHPHLGNDSHEVPKCLQLSSSQGLVGSQLHSQQVVKSRLQVCGVQLGPEKNSDQLGRILPAFQYKAPLVSATIPG